MFFVEPANEVNMPSVLSCLTGSRSMGKGKTVFVSTEEARPEVAGAAG